MSFSLLLIEPHADSREMYAEFLEHEGFIVRTAGTIAEAGHVAHTVDALVTDTTIGRDGDGLDLVRELRSAPATRRLPIVALTSNTLRQDAAHAEAAGCDLLLARPCLPADLVSAVRRALAWRRSGSPRMIKFTVPTSRRKSG